MIQHNIHKFIISENVLSRTKKYMHMKKNDFTVFRILFINTVP